MTDLLHNQVVQSKLSRRDKRKLKRAGGNPPPRIVERTIPFPGNIAVAFDGSEVSRQALAVALRLTRIEKPKLRMIFVGDLPRYPATVSEVNAERACVTFGQLRRQAMDAAKKAGVEVVAEKRMGRPAQALVHYVKEASIDLLVMGHTGHSKFMGTTTNKVVRHGACLSVKEAVSKGNFR